MYQRLIEIALTLALAVISGGAVHVYHLTCDSGCQCQTCKCDDCQCCGACSSVACGKMKAKK